VPKPRPPEPSAYNTDDVYGMLNEIASSSWDSIQEQASRPIVKERPLPRPKAYAKERVGPAGVAVLATSVLVGGWLTVVLGAAHFEMRQIANASPPRVTGEIIVVEALAPDQVGEAATASQAMPADDQVDYDLEPEQPSDNQLAPFNFPPRPVLISGLRDAALHGLIY
jgi:hypothetical protein